MAMSYEDFLDIAKDAAKTRHPEAASLSGLKERMPLSP